MADGDSITAGTGVTTPWTQLISPQTYVIHNVAVPAETLATMLANYPTVVAPFFKAGHKNLIVLWAGTNDIEKGTTPAAVYASLTSYVAQAHATGFKIIVTTMLSRGIPGVGNFDPQKNAYNSLIQANTAGADGIASYVNTLGGCDGCFANTLWFNTDEVHPNDNFEIQYEVPGFSAAIALQ